VAIEEYFTNPVLSGDYMYFISGIDETRFFKTWMSAQVQAIVLLTI
jgi:hypothetical protein